MLTAKYILKNLIFYIIAIIFTSFNICTIKIAGLQSVIASFDVVSIFYFAVFKNLFGLWFIFLLGIWGDALSNNAIGISSLSYIVMVKFFQVANNKLIIKENFYQIWKQFSLFFAFILIIKWLLLSMIASNFYPVYKLLMQLILTVSFYPIIHKFLNFFSKKITGEN